VLTATTHIKARLFIEEAETEWSALNEATFKVAESKGKIVITEIMYNPVDGNDYEFIELQNIGEGEFSLAGLYFDEGITFTFPPGQPSLAPGERVVLVHNAAAFAERYPGVAIGGVYQGKLANEGEKITLRDTAGQVLVSLAYDDENGWPFSADGHGDALVSINAAGDPAQPQNWRVSRYPNGTPGAAEAE
jgi:hypothetical protein